MYRRAFRRASKASTILSVVGAEMSETDCLASLDDLPF